MATPVLNTIITQSTHSAAPVAPVVSAANTAAVASTESLPGATTLLQAAKISCEQDRAIMLDYFRQTANGTAFLGEDPETKERILVKSKEETL